MLVSLLLLPALADNTASLPAPHLASDYSQQRVSVEAAAAEQLLRADRARAAELARLETWWELQTPTEVATTELVPVRDVAHLLGGVVQRKPASEALASVEAQDEWAPKVWGYQRLRSHARVAADGHQLLFWVKEIHRGRGVWTEERDVLVTLDEQGRVARAYTTDPRGVESLTKLRWDPNNELAAVDFVRLTTREGMATDATRIQYSAR